MTAKFDFEDEIPGNGGRFISMQIRGNSLALQLMLLESAKRLESAQVNQAVLMNLLIKLV